MRIHLRAASQRALLEGEGDTYRGGERAMGRLACNGGLLLEMVRSCKMLWKKQRGMDSFHKED